jgi:oligosaccharide repeat unit polymerase
MAPKGERILSTVVTLAIPLIVSSSAIIFIGDERVSSLNIIILLLLLLVVWIPPLLQLLRSSRIDFANPLYLFAIFYSLVFILRPVVILVDTERSDFSLMVISGDFDAAVTITLIYALLGAFAFQLGYSSRLSRTRVDSYQRIAYGRPWTDRQVYLMTLVYVGVGVMSYLTFIRSLGGLGNIIRGIGAEFSEEASGKYYLAAGTGFVHALTLLLNGISAVRRKHTLLALSLLLLSIGLSFTFGQRGSIFVVVLSTFLIHYCGRNWHRRLNLFLLLFMGVTGYLFIALGYIRYNTVGNRSSEQVVEILAEFLRGSLGLFLKEVAKEFCQFDYAAALVAKIPEILPFQYGRTFLDTFLLPIPRQLWPGKPLPIDFVVTQLLTPQFGGGKPISLIGELYLNFHVPGILIGMFLFGVGWQRLYVHFVKTRSTLDNIVVYTLILSYMPLLLTRSLAFMLANMMSILLPILFATWCLRVRR